MDCVKVVGVLLAAGAGTRFGGNKLEAMLGDAMLGMHAARTLAGMELGSLIAVHDPAHEALAAGLCGLGFQLIDNADPAAGLSQSIALATRAAMTGEAHAMLVCLADMPFVTEEHLSAVLGAGDGGIVASAVGDARMPPAFFPRPFWSYLAQLSGANGARTMLANAQTVAGDPAILADIDTVAILNEARQICAELSQKQT